MMTYAAQLVGFGLASWLLVYAVRYWAQRRRVFDIPNQRSSHSHPTPLGGGVGIVVVTLIAGAWYAASHPLDVAVRAYLIAAGLIALIGWLDDLRALSSLVRLVCHVLGAVVLLLNIDLASLAVGLGVPWWLIAVALLVWIVGLTNIYNFMDGIDGLAGVQGVVAGLWWTVAGTYLGLPSVTTLALSVAASTVGFLQHNWPPARIFMGDVGSTFLGYTFAALPLLGVRARGDWSLLFAGALPLFPFLFDGALTIVRRALQGENLFQAHRSHLYQRLVIQGKSHRAVSSLYALYAALSGVAGFAIVTGRWPGAVALVPLGLGTLLYAWVLRGDQLLAGERALSKK